MREHFTDYNTAYADALNEQMLLNLARLQNGHPAYYLAIGSIDDRMTVTGTANIGNGNSTLTDAKTVPASGAISRVLTSVFGFNASGSATRTVNPEFTFIPLNNEAISQQVLQPVSTEVFFTLYQQGYPIDQLMRVLIERVETTLPGRNGQELVLVNSPTRGTPESYARFLRACAILRELQRRGYLSLEATNESPDILGPVSFGASSTSRGSGSSATGVNSATESQSSQPNTSGGGKSNYADPAIKDYSDVQAKNWTLIPTANGWQLGALREAPIFVLKTNVDTDDEVATAATSPTNRFSSKQSSDLDDPFVASIERDVAYFISQSDLKITTNQVTLIPILVKSLCNTNFIATNTNVIEDDVKAVFTVIGLLNEGISVQTKIGGETQARTRLVLRSFGRAMEAVASEQPAFDALMKTNRMFRSIVPEMEMNPILRIDWSSQSGRPLLPPLKTVRYAGKTYELTDPALGPLDANVSWNRDIFRLMVALNSQVTVDISKFQQQVFELRSD